MINDNNQSDWKVWEVFIQSKTGEPYVHAGNVHAADPEMALQNARDVYSRRNEAISLWVVPSDQIVSTSPSDSGPFFEPSNEKIYRHPQFYKVPKEVRGF